jgi:hypothetical protein
MILTKLKNKFDNSNSSLNIAIYISQPNIILIFYYSFIPVVTCKAGWESLKDGLRYQTSGIQKKRFKSGDSGDEAESQIGTEWTDNKNEALLTSWKFWDEMKFFQEKPTRK